MLTQGEVCPRCVRLPYFALIVQGIEHGSPKAVMRVRVSLGVLDIDAKRKGYGKEIG